MRLYTSLTFCTISFLTFFSGIIRDDVPEAAYRELANQPQFNCVGQVFTDTTAAGSCVLISDQFVLTAAHVLITSDVRKDTIQMNGQTLIAYVPINERVSDASSIFIEFSGQRVRAKKLILHPGFLKDITEGDFDIALIQLEEPIHAIVPAKVYASAEELTSNVIGVGYGASGKANKPDSVSTQSMKIAGENVIDQVTGPKHEGKETILSCDFDAASIKGCNKMGSPVPRPLEYICSGGDSGGGLFKQTGNEWFLVGICSGGQTDIKQLMKTGYYGQIMDWTRVSAFTQWIQEHINP
jgi:secreted trypsin-like serine protease